MTGELSLDLERLENVKHLGGGGIRAACPACRAADSDKSRDHLLIQPDGKYGCAVYPKDHEHRSQIFRLAGNGFSPNQSHPAVCKKPITPRIKASGADFDWKKCVAGFTGAEMQNLATKRGYALDFVRWLHEQGIVGISNGKIAFANHGPGGNVVSAHVRLPNGKWIFEPKGHPVALLAFGDISSAGTILAFESQWDAFSVMDKLGWHTTNGLPGTAVFITRGAGNGKFIRGRLSPEAVCYAFKQNDAPTPKGPVPPSNSWFDAIVSNSGCKVLNVSTPEPYKDTNDWTRAGATKEQLEAAMAAARSYEITDAAPALVLQPVSPETGWKSTATRTPETVKTEASTASTAPDCADSTRMFILPNDHQTISESARNIFTTIAGTHTLFIRSGSIVELIKNGSGSALELIKPESFRSRLERYGHNLFAFKIDDDGGKVLKPKRCSEDNAKALLATIEARTLLPKICTVAAAPVIVPDGDGIKILGKGFHNQNGGTLVTGGEMPTEMAAEEAAKLLLASLDEFRFQCPGDKARAFAAMLTPALKMGGFIRGFIPVDVREADESQTGKGFSLILVRATYRESAYPIALKSGGVGSLDESICSALISGKPFIAIDNVRGKLDSQFLEMVITWGDAVAARIPFKGEMLVDPGAASFQLTSNGIEATPDFAKRASITRMLKQPPGFVFKKYTEGNVLDHVIANQPRYLGAVFSLIRDWCRRGKPISEVSGHDFREWASILNSFTVNYMGEYLLTGHEQAQERTANPALSWLRAVGLLVLKRGKAGQEMPAAELYELSSDEQLDIPGMRQPDDQQGPQAVGRVLAKCFRDSERVEVDHITIERIKRSEYDESSRKDVDRKTYCFTDVKVVGGAERAD
jgi:hypothetical protein